MKIDSIQKGSNV